MTSTQNRNRMAAQDDANEDGLSAEGGGRHWVFYAGSDFVGEMSFGGEMWSCKPRVGARFEANNYHAARAQLGRLYWTAR